MPDKWMTKADLLKALEDVPDDHPLCVHIKDPVYWNGRKDAVIPTYTLASVDIEWSSNTRPVFVWLQTGTDIDDGVS